MTPEQVAQQHSRMATDYNDLLCHVRTLPGFEDFLLPLKIKALVAAARHGPIAVINCDEHSCDALVILPGQDTITHIPLPNFDKQKARHIRFEMGKCLRNKRLRDGRVERRVLLQDQEEEFEIVLAALWHDVVKPILDHLGYTVRTHSHHQPTYTYL
jgi:hypothetical protein